MIELLHDLIYKNRSDYDSTACMGHAGSISSTVLVTYIAPTSAEEEEHSEQGEGRDEQTEGAGSAAAAEEEEDEEEDGGW